MKNSLIVLLATGLFFFACEGKKKEKEQLEVTDADVPLLNEDMEGVETFVFNNTYVKALKVNLGVNEQLAWHEGGPRVIYALSDYEILFKRNPDDTTSEQKIVKKGVAHWHEENIHTLVNVGSRNAEFLVFMRKSLQFPKEEALSAESEVEQMETAETEKLLENDAVEVTRIKLEPGKNTPEHFASNRLIYSLSDFNINFNKEGQTPIVNEIEGGQAHWHAGGEHSIENIGEEEAEFLMVQFKK